MLNMREDTPPSLSLSQVCTFCGMQWRSGSCPVEAASISSKSSRISARQPSGSAARRITSAFTVVLELASTTVCPKNISRLIGSWTSAVRSG